MKILSITMIVIACLFVFNCTVSEIRQDNAERRDIREKISQGVPFERSRPFPEHCYDGYLYVQFTGGSHSGVIGVSPKIGPDGFIEC